MKAIKLGLLTVTSFLYWQDIGAAYIKWDIGGAASEIYDDNITFSNSNQVSDAITRLSLITGLRQEDKFGKMDLHAEVTQELFAKNTNFNNLSEGLKFNAVRDLSPYDKVEAHDTFSHSQEPRSFEDAFGRSNGRYSSYENNLNLKYGRQFSEQWAAGLKYLQKNYSFTRSDLSDSAEYAPGFFTTYALSSADQLLLDYDYQRWTFDPGSQADNHVVSTGLRHYLTQQLYVEARPGVSIINDFNGRTLTKPRYEASISDDVDENTNLNLSYVKEYGITPFAQEIFNNWRVVLAATRQLTARWKANVSAFYGRGRYLTTDIRDRLTGGNAGLEYAVTPYMNLFCNYTYEHTKSNIDTRTYTRNVVWGGIKFMY